MYALFIEPYWPQVKHVNICTDKLKQAEFTIVHISDLHCDKNPRLEQRLADIINPLNADVIVFTGDALNTRGALPLLKSTLTSLSGQFAKLAVKGNWDVWYWKDVDLFSGTGFEELKGNHRAVTKNSETITVTGLEPAEWPGFLNGVVPVPPESYRILLYHYPGINEEIGNDKFDLILSGHTHGGQIALPFYGALTTLSKYGKKYESGLYPLAGGSALYVNKGLGMEGGIVPRLRFLSRPEITVFHIRPSANCPGR